jgi:hypothetical protein
MAQLTAMGASEKELQHILDLYENPNLRRVDGKNQMLRLKLRREDRTRVSVHNEGLAGLHRPQADPEVENINDMSINMVLRVLRKLARMRTWN